MVGSYVSTKWFKHSYSRLATSRPGAEGRNAYLNREGSFTHTSIPQHHQFVERHFSSHDRAISRFHRLVVVNLLSIF
jgi:hypothetical protein